MRIPRQIHVLAVWAAATLLTWLLARLGAADTPLTPWAPASPSWTQHVSFWDSGWYARVWREGYPSVLPVDESGRVAQNAWAFMPGLPLVAGMLARVAGALGLGGAAGAGDAVDAAAAAGAAVPDATFYACAALVSLLASAAAALLADRWLAPRVGSRASLWAVGLAWSAPCALVMQVAYAEALALALTLAALLLVERRRFLAAAPLLACAALTRPVGAPLTAALALWWLVTTPPLASVRERLTVRAPGSWSLSRRESSGLAALTVWAAACTFAWPLAAWVATGRRDAYTATETAWRGEGLPTFLPVLGRSGTWVGTHLGWVLVLAAGAAAVCVLSSRALRSLGPVAWCWCTAYCLYLAAVFDPTTSLFRLLIPLAPAFWALAPALAARGTRTLVAAVACGIAGQALWISWVWDLGSVTVHWVP